MERISATETPADATIVSTGTGTKGPEERELPESLSNDMSLCLRILRDVLGEYDPQLLATFDTVRNYATIEREGSVSGSGEGKFTPQLVGTTPSCSPVHSPHISTSPT